MRGRDGAAGVPLRGLGAHLRVRSPVRHLFAVSLPLLSFLPTPSPTRSLSLDCLPTPWRFDKKLFLLQLGDGPFHRIYTIFLTRGVRGPQVPAKPDVAVPGHDRPGAGVHLDYRLGAPPGRRRVKRR